MRSIFAVLLFASVSYEMQAQQVPRKTLVEHFTNTYCSVCASRNPGFYDNLKNFPETLHIAYHPSSPYAACPLSMQNKVENDARTHFYDVFGGTPRLVINGEMIPNNADYSAASIFTPYLMATSSFVLRTTLTQTNASTLSATIVLKKVDVSNVTNLSLYSVIVEDTLHFNARNGETLHQDVFRKSFVGADPQSISAPVNVGDSIVFNQTMSIGSDWNLAQCYAIAIIAAPDKKMEQAAASSKITGGITSIPTLSEEDKYTIFPVPVSNKLYLKGKMHQAVTATIYDAAGKMQLSKNLQQGTFIDVSLLASGLYILHIQAADGVQVTKFSKR